MNPTVINEDDQIGLLFRLGENYNSSDYNKLTQDTLTIRYCDKPMKCQSYSLNTQTFDYQVNLGSIGRFIDDNDDLEPVINEDEEPRAEDDVLYMSRRFKVYYQGDLIRMIGFMRPPLSYFNSNGKDLEEEYFKAKQSSNADMVITVNLEDVSNEILPDDTDKSTPNMSDDNKFDITIYPDKFVMFLLPNNKLDWSILEHEIDKIIPSIDDIIKLYFNKKNANIDYIYKVINKFEYDSNEISYNIQNKLLECHEDYIYHWQELNKKIQNQFYDYKKEKERNEKYFESEEGKKAKEKLDNKKFKYITNVILDDINKFYYKQYENKGISIDSDDIRLRWFMNSIDNGRYFFKTLFMNYLKTYQEGYKLENLETELSLLKDKHTIHQQTTQTLTLNTGNSSSNCFTKLELTPNIIKYPSLSRLEQDNGKVAVDSEGNVIMSGDYALVDVEGAKQLYKREVIANVDMWIKEDLATIYKLIQDKKNACITNPEMKLQNANSCIFNMENIKCEDNVELNAMKQSLDMERNIADLQKQIDYIKHLPILISNLDKEIMTDRATLLNSLNNSKRYWKQKEEDDARLTAEIAKTITRVKPCPHFDITDYLLRIGGYGDEKYQLAQTIIRNFLNTNFDKGFTKIHITSEDGFDHNFSYCNICNQQLICNHFRLGISYLEENKPIDYNRIIDIYTKEQDGGHICTVCGELIATTAILDIDDFAKGEDAGRVKTREVMEDIPLIEKQKQYIDNLINKLIDGQPSAEADNLQEKLKIYNLLKGICGLSKLSIEDEVNMINFIKSYQFTTKDAILTVLKAKIGVGNLVLLKKKLEQLYMIYLWCDISSRFLITLQTTKTPYEIRNSKMLSSGMTSECKQLGVGGTINIIGYPLIDELDAMNGIQFLLCVLGQIATLPDYSSLGDITKDTLIKQMRKQVEDDNFIKTKLENTRNGIAENIDYIYEFQNYETNYWKSFLPRMSFIQLGWTPEKLLNEANLKEVSNKNWHRMIEVGNENNVFHCLQIIKSINNVVNNSDHNASKSISSFCCPYKNTSDSRFQYLDYFTNKDSSILDNLHRLEKTNSVMMKLWDIRRQNVYNMQYEPLLKPSQMVMKFNLDTTPDEIKEIFHKFIDSGINKGKLHIYDKYGRCILSNNKERDILERTYTQKDYKLIEDAITNTNTINIYPITQTSTTPIDSITPDIFKPETNLEHLEMQLISKLIHKMPKNPVMNYLKDFFNKIKDNINTIFKSKNTNTTETKIKITSGGTISNFNIHTHLSQLNSQIQTEINSLVSRLTSVDKISDKYIKILSNVGNFRSLYEEYMKDHTIENANRFRYNKMETAISGYIKYLNDIICNIKNGKLSNPLNKEKIKTQFREFLQYAENIKVFKIIDNANRDIYHYSKELKSKYDYKVLFPEMIVSILHYLFIISLVNLFETMDNSKIRNGKTDILEYNFIKKIQQDTAIVEYSNEMDIDLVNTDVYLDDNGQPIDLLDNIRITNSNNIKMISNFIITFIERINITQDIYDELTLEKVNNLIVEDKQKKIEQTLKSFEWLNKEDNEENYLLLKLQMKLNRVGYRNIVDYLSNQYGKDFYEEENDEYKGNNLKEPLDGKEDVNDGANAIEIKEEDAGVVVAFEDLDDGDMDYGYIAVGEDD